MKIDLQIRMNRYAELGLNGEFVQLVNTGLFNK